MKARMSEIKDGLTALAIGAGGAILTSWAVNFIPGVKNANPLTRSLAQLGLGGAVALFAPGKLRLVRYIGLGTAWAGALGAVERATKMKTLAGNPETTLSPSEIRRLQTMGAIPIMNGPALMRSMNGPTTFRSMAGAGRPSMMGAFKAPT